jgi:hypothetical protein
MDTENTPIQFETGINEKCVWWHDRRVRIIGISFTVLLLLAVTLSLVLLFAVSARNKSHSSTTTTTQAPGTVRRYIFACRN